VSCPSSAKHTVAGGQAPEHQRRERLGAAGHRARPGCAAGGAARAPCRRRRWRRPGSWSSWPSAGRPAAARDWAPCRSAPSLPACPALPRAWPAARRSPRSVTPKQAGASSSCSSSGRKAEGSTGRSTCNGRAAHVLLSVQHGHRGREQAAAPELLRELHIQLVIVLRRLEGQDGQAPEVRARVVPFRLCKAQARFSGSRACPPSPALCSSTAC